MTTLKVRSKEKGTHVFALSPTGETIIDIRNTYNRETRGTDTVITTEIGTLHLVRTPGQMSLVDQAGTELAAVVAVGRGRSEIVVPTGERWECRGRKLGGYRYTVGDLVTAKAPLFAPQRYVRLTLSEVLDARPDRVAITALAMYKAEDFVSMAIISQNSAPM